jgi:hypothetical protein
MFDLILTFTFIGLGTVGDRYARVTQIRVEEAIQERRCVALAAKANKRALVEIEGVLIKIEGTCSPHDITTSNVDKYGPPGRCAPGWNLPGCPQVD